jgi:hypothetical protein
MQDRFVRPRRIVNILLKIRLAVFRTELSPLVAILLSRSYELMGVGKGHCETREDALV